MFESQMDLHLHSIYSDGSDSPEHVMRILKDKSINVFAFADHDTDFWIGECSLQYQNLSEQLGLKLIRAVELSTRDYYTSKKAHLLAYWPEGESFISENLRNIIDKTVQMRNEIAGRQIDCLSALGFGIDYQTVLQSTLTGQIFKRHIMEAIRNTGRLSLAEYRQFHREHFAKGKACYFPKNYPDISEVLKAIVDSGAIPVLAHPGHNDNYEIIPRLAEQGLLGVEYNHPTHSDEDKIIISRFSFSHNLLLSGGSDYHGKYYRSGVIGEFVVPSIFAEKWKDLLKVE